MSDKTIICRDCGNEFVFTKKEQASYVKHGFEDNPARCKDCRNKKRFGNRPDRTSNNKD